jgi:hypothetical protein
MIAARTARQARHDEPAQHRGVIGFLLLHRIEETDRYPGVWLALLVAVILLASAIAPSVPQ